MKGIPTSLIAAMIVTTFGAFCVNPAPAQNAAPAYLVAEVKVTDAAGFADYAAKYAPMLAAYSGRVVVRGGAQSLEGAPPSGGIVVITFPSMEKAREFWNSPEYQALVPMRQKVSTASIYLVEGLPQ
jgi:uncharacterized protein (DUF1330 family)